MSKNMLCIEFAIDSDGQLFSVKRNNDDVMNCTFSDGVLDFSLLYDYNQEMSLHLTALAKIGDNVKINILPYRIELYIADILSDEEWPCGNHFISCETVAKGNCNIKIYDAEYVKPCEKAVLGSFCNAEGWKPEENVFVGDCMPYTHDGRYHVLYLKDRHHHKSKWRKGAHQWSHISTKDFVNWDIHPMAVEIDHPSEASICTGSWIYDGARHYLFYTIRSCDASPARITRSVSQDGYHFEKDRNFCFTLSSKYNAASARDPKVIKGEDGVYHMILTTSLSENGRGCLAHLVSENLDEWSECEDPLFIAPEGEGEPECPDYFYKDGYYYLVYSLKIKGYYLYSKNPFTDWITPKNPVIPCKSVPKAAIWNDRLIFTGFDGNGFYAGTMTFMEAFVQDNGELKYKTKA